MKKLISLLAPVLLIIGATGLTTSCERYEVELYNDGKADLNIVYDWSAFKSRYGYKPDGLTYMAARNGDKVTIYPATHNVDATTDLRLEPGHYLFTVMNKSFGEYSTISFVNRNSHQNACARSKTYYVHNETLWDNGRLYMEEPENIGIGVDTFDVPKSIDDLEFYYWRDYQDANDIHIKRNVTVWPMTTTLNIIVKVRGISYMRSMEGYVTGMADGFYLNQTWRTSEVGTLKLVEWERDLSDKARRAAASEEDPNVGWMTCKVTTFGLPHGRELVKWRTKESNYIMLHFTLLDGKTKDFAYYVGKNVRYVNDNGELDVFKTPDVRLALNLVIDAPFYNDDEVPILPYAQPEGSGQFDAEVEPWGDDENVDVPM